MINALSFYRSQNVLCWSKCFVPDKMMICIQLNWFLCRHKRFWRGTKCSQIFGLAQNIWTSSKHFGTCKRTRHKCNSIFGLSQNIWTSTKHFGTWRRTRPNLTAEAIRFKGWHRSQILHHFIRQVLSMWISDRRNWITYLKKSHTICFFKIKYIKSKHLS